MLKGGNIKPVFACIGIKRVWNDKQRRRAGITYGCGNRVDEAGEGGGETSHCTLLNCGQNTLTMGSTLLTKV